MIYTSNNSLPIYFRFLIAEATNLNRDRKQVYNVYPTRVTIPECSDGVTYVRLVAVKGLTVRKNSPAEDDF